MKLCLICGGKTSKSNAKYCTECRSELDKRSRYLTGVERQNTIFNMVNDKKKTWKQ